MCPIPTSPSVVPPKLTVPYIVEYILKKNYTILVVNEFGSYLIILLKNISVYLYLNVTDKYMEKWIDLRFPLPINIHQKFNV